MKKYIISFLILICCAFTTLSFSGCFSVTTSSTNKPQSENGFVFKDYGDGCKLEDYTGRNADIIIPSQNLAGKKVIRIDDNAFQEYRMRSLVIPETVKEIGDDAFYKCNDLKKVTFNGTLKQWLEMDVECSPLNQSQHVDLYLNNNVVAGDITIDEGVKKIANYAFYKQAGITSITLPNSVEKVGNYAFYGLNKIKSITIPENVTEVGWFAFCDCVAVTNVNILSNKLSVLDDYAFRNLKNLKSIVLPNSLNEISEGLFRECENLETVVFPNDYRIIGAEAFFKCKKLKEITIPSALWNIGESALGGCETLREISLPENIKYIRDGVFQGCTSLEKVVCTSNLKEIGSGAFYNCINLKSIEKADKSKMATVEKFDSNCFYGCKNLETFFIGDETKYVKNGAFSKCEKLEKAIFSNNLIELGSNAFADCPILDEVCLPNKNLEYGTPVFGEGASLKKITAPHDVVKTIINKSNLEEVYLTTGDKIEESEYSGCTKLKTISLPATIKSIGNNAFLGVTSIIDFYFEGTMDTWCQLKFENPISEHTQNLYINQTKVIGENCPELELVFFNEQNEYTHKYVLTSVSDYAFHNFSNLKKVVLHEGVTKIGVGAFGKCSNLEELQFGNKLVDIKADAFKDCVNIEKLNFMGTIQEWCKVAFENEGSAPTYYGAQLYFNGTIVPSTLTFDEKFTSMGSYAFANQKNITSITLDYYKLNQSGSYNKTRFAGCSNVVYAKGCADLFASLLRRDGFEPALNLETAIIKEETLGTRLSDEFFKDCTKLTEIQIDFGVSNIGKNAFVNTAYYNDESNWINGVLYVPNLPTNGNQPKNYYVVSAKPEAVSSDGKLNLTGDVRYIADYTFANMGIKELTLFSTTKILTVGEGAFMNNRIKELDLSSVDLTSTNGSLYLSSTVKRIGADAFANNDHLRFIKLNVSSLEINPKYVIAATAFSGCDNILMILNPRSSSSSTVSMIPHKYVDKNFVNKYFYNGSEVDLFRVKDKTTNDIIEEILVEYKGLSETFDASSKDYTDIWSYAFESEETLKELTLSNNLKKDNIIVNCKELETIKFTDAVDSINSKAIVDCDKLTKIYASVGLWTDGENTFNYTSIEDAEAFAQFVLGKEATISKVQE